MHHFWDVLVQWGPLGVFVIAVVESLGVPNPGGRRCAAAGGRRKPRQCDAVRHPGVSGSLLGGLGF